MTPLTEDELARPLTAEEEADIRGLRSVLPAIDADQRIYVRVGTLRALLATLDAAQTLNGRAIGRAMHEASQVGGPWHPCSAPYASPDCEHESMGLHVASVLRATPVADTAAPLRDWQRDLLAFDADGRSLDQVVADLLGVKSVNLRAEQDNEGNATSEDRRWRVQYFGGTYGGTLFQCRDSDTPLADTAGIDAAWREAEAALPEGWRLSVAQHPDNFAAFATSGLVTRGGAPVGLGPTPAAALLALAAALRTPKPEGEPE